MDDLKRGDPVTQHLGYAGERHGRVISVSGTTAIVEFECGRRHVTIATLTLRANLDRLNLIDNDNVGT